MAHSKKTSFYLERRNPPPETTVRDLRKKYGPEFAPGYGDTDTLGPILARAGVSTLDEFLQLHQK